MRGNITRRGKSSWRLKYDGGTGSQRQIAYVTVKGTRKQAEAELAKRLSELAEGRYVAPAVETVETMRGIGSRTSLLRGAQHRQSIVTAA
jgi:hypothetical protein